MTSIKPVPSLGLGHLRIVLSESAYIGPGQDDVLAGTFTGMGFIHPYFLLQSIDRLIKFCSYI